MSSMKIAIGIATAGRPDAMRSLMDLLTRQSRPADKVVICPANPSDIGMPLSSVPSGVFVVPASRGLCKQRNAILETVQGYDLITFIDDDFVPATDYLAEIERAFTANPLMVAASGYVMADGIHGPGIELGAALEIIARQAAEPQLAFKQQYNGYGCNMTFRLPPIVEHNLRFDENLPLYGWLEDVDFSRRIGKFGDICYLYRPRGVHLGTKIGRSPGLRLGYSQVANPVYLARKGTLDWNVAVRHIRGNFLSNLGKTFWPETWVDRAGRLKGNFLAIAHLMQGKLDPKHVLKL